MADLEQLREEIHRLSPSDQLRLAAELLDAGRLELARAVAARIVAEIGAVQAMTAKEPGR